PALALRRLRRLQRLWLLHVSGECLGWLRQRRARHTTHQPERGTVAREQRTHRRVRHGRSRLPRQRGWYARRREQRLGQRTPLREPRRALLRQPLRPQLDSKRVAEL